MVPTAGVSRRTPCMATTVLSERLFERAARLIPGGVNSPVRAWRAVGGKPIFIQRAKGCTLKMAESLDKMVHLAWKLLSPGKGSKLLSGEPIGRPSEDGYFPRGILKNEYTEKTAAGRSVDMLLLKLEGKMVHTEAERPRFQSVLPPPPIRKDLSECEIALISDGGLVPKGNPDRIEARAATKFGAYDITGVDALKPEKYRVSHSGYSVAFVEEDPHRLLPVDVLRDLEKDGVIGKLHETFYSTSGCASIVGNCKKMGEGIAAKLKSAGVSGVILTST